MERCNLGRGPRWLALCQPGGTLSLGLPDLDRAVQADARGDRRHFSVPDDDAPSLGGKLAVQVSWHDQP